MTVSPNPWRGGSRIISSPPDNRGGGSAAARLFPEMASLLKMTRARPAWIWARSRAARMDEFEVVDRHLAGAIGTARSRGVNTIVMPVIKTPEELRAGSMLHLDMTDQARILFDRDNLLRDYLGDLGRRLTAMGARRVPFGGGYYWELKPDFRWGDRIEL